MKNRRAHRLLRVACHGVDDMTPRVSVVIPTYNRARDLERALDSVVAQSFRDLEVLVVDNHSTDDTAAVVERYNDSRIALHFVTNEGIVARSRNLGIRRARGEFVAFLDSDDWWTPRKLEASVAVLDAGADVVYHHLFLVTRPHQNVLWRRVWARDISSPVFDDLLLNGTALPQSSVVMRRDLLLSVGGMPEERDVVAMEDYLCWLKAARMTEGFARVRGTLGYYWAGGGNLSSATRTLRVLDRLKAIFTQELASGGVRKTPSWVSYARGCAYLETNDRENARHHLRLARSRGAPMRTLLKSLVAQAAVAFAPAARRSP